MNLLELIESFVDFRREVVRRRTEFELRRRKRGITFSQAEDRARSLDAVITLIRGSRLSRSARRPDDAVRAVAGPVAGDLDMQLQRLTGLERQKILDELAELLKTIERLRAILASDRLADADHCRRAESGSRQDGDDRRTEIVDATGEINVEDLIAEEDMAITVSNTGYIKRTAISTYRNQRRGGKRPHRHVHPRRGLRQSPVRCIDARLHHDLLGPRRAYWLKVHEIPDVGPGGKGKSIANLVSMEEGEKIAAMLAVKEFEDDKFVVMGTRRGVVKKTALSGFSNPRAGGIIAMGVEEGDAVITVQVTDGSAEIFIGTRNGMAIRFTETDVRPMGRAPMASAASRCVTTTMSWRWKRFGRAEPCSRSPSAALAADRNRRIPCAVARRRRYHQHFHVGPERHGGRRRLRAEGDELLVITQQGMIIRMQTNDVQPSAHHAGRETHRHRRRGPGVHRAPRRERGRRAEHVTRFPDRRLVCIGRDPRFGTPRRVAARPDSRRLFRRSRAIDPQPVLHRIPPGGQHIAQLRHDGVIRPTDPGHGRQLHRHERLSRDAQAARVEGAGESARGCEGRRFAFTKRKEEYQNANLDVIQRVLKADRDTSKLKGKDAEVQATWSKYVQDGAAVSRKVQEAKRKLAAEGAVVELSINGGSNNPLDIRKYDGELVSKDVTIDAAVKPPAGAVAQKTLVVTLQRAVLKGDKDITGRWIITSIKDAALSPGSPATPRS
jgi:hypothetical protein